MDRLCHHCRRLNRADARYCDGCGAALQQVAASPEAAGEHAPADPSFIGRERELLAVEKLLGRALAGAGATVSISGEPGIGKTHTAQVVAQRAAARGMQVFWGRCNEEPGAPPYWPWIQLIQAWLKGHDDETARRSLGSAAAALAEVLPELVQRVPECAPLPAIADPLQARFRLFDAINGFWKRAAADQPLLLILDNLHWADASSLRLLEFLAPDLASSPMLVAVTYRDMELSRQHPLSGTLGELSRQQGFERLRLTGFSREETASMMALAGGGALPATLVGEIHSRTEGNPLFVAEMTRLLVQEDLLVPVQGEPHTSQHGVALHRIPEGIREVIGRRLNRLAPRTNQVLTCAAMIGRSFDAALLPRLMDDVDEESCNLALEEALQARVIESLPEPGRYHFGHALFRDTLYEEIAAPRRSGLHLRVARALESAPNQDLSRHLPALAYHCWAALPAGDAARAVDYARRAAEQAGALLAHEEATRYYGLALQGMDAGSGFEPVLRCQLLAALGEAHTRAGEYLLAQEALEQAARLALRSGCTAELARAALGYEMASWCPGMPGFIAARLLREALNAVDPDHLTLVARLLSALARALIFSGEEEQAMKVYAQALAIARRCGDPQILASTLVATLTARWQHERSSERIACAEEAGRLAAAAGDRALELDASAWRMFDSFELGDLPHWLNTIDRYERGAEELREPFLRYVAASSRTMHALFEGRFDEAEQLAKRTLEIGDRMPGLDAAGVYGVQMFTLRREQGRLEEVGPVVRQIVQTNPHANVWRPGLALIYAELGQLDAARAEFDMLAAEDFRTLVRDGVWVASVAYLAQVCAALGDGERARVLHALLLPYSGRNLLAGTSIACLGPADTLLGMLSTTVKDWAGAERHFVAALAMNQRQGARPALAHTRHAYAAMLLARGAGADREYALGLLTAAAADAAALGMRALARRIEASRQPLCKAAPAPLYPAGLSQREAQVLRFVAAGKSNRQIASELFVSPNTVANHIRSILGKTQSNNRTEAAAFAIRHAIVDGPQSAPRRATQ
ncbi:MAG: transcriptional regulator, LuxR family [Ramlibacter sp.]|nr:transcriptional regulator, LuxR family [Ramlibacter sp.]